MYLKQIEISGFRGINRLSLSLLPNMVLIGENAWGKSSLIDALSLIFNLENHLYQFTFKDFHIQYSHTPKQVQDIELVFTFAEEYVDECLADKFAPYQSLFFAGAENTQQLSLKVSGKLTQESVITEYHFVDQFSEPIPIPQSDKRIKQFIRQHAVYRLRDARLNKRVHDELLLQNHHDNADEFQRELNALSSLLKYYFLTAQSRSLMKTNMQDTSLWWEKVKSLCLRLKQNELLREKVQRHISALFLFKQADSIDKPIILFEDLNAQLPPRMVAIFWELLSLLPSQRITITNSMELVSQVPLKEICRLVRYKTHTQAYLLERNQIGKDDLRKLTFHIHHNRGLALFARAWILVEGETEVWILSELAKLLEINLEMEGIKIVEFAQCGLRPLIKYARAMGIEWYVLTDGDEAGKRYADTVKSMDENFSERLTTLPQKDIEHFFYKAGLRNVFVRLANWRSQDKFPISYIIKRAIQQNSKPDLAIALSNEMRTRGEDSVPRLFKNLFANVLALVNRETA